MFLTFIAVASASYCALYYYRRLKLHDVIPYYTLVDMSDCDITVKELKKRGVIILLILVFTVFIAYLSFNFLTYQTTKDVINDNLPYTPAFFCITRLFNKHLIYIIVLVMIIANGFYIERLYQSIICLRVWKGAVIKYGLEKAKQMAQDNVKLTNPQIDELVRFAKTKEKKSD